MDEPGWLDRRVDFLAEGYGNWTGQTREQIAEELATAEERLQTSATRYHLIVLWFEHDPYDQLVLARCLAKFAETPPVQLELISAARYPGSTPFIGLGQLPPEALRLLWKEREGYRRKARGSGTRSGPCCARPSHGPSRSWRRPESQAFSSPGRSGDTARSFPGRTTG